MRRYGWPSPANPHLVYRCPYCSEAAGRVQHATTLKWHCYWCDKPWDDSQGVPDPNVTAPEVRAYARALGDWYMNNQQGPKPVGP